MQDHSVLENHTTEISRTPETSQVKHTLKRKFILGITVIIVPVLGLLFTWLSVKLNDQAREETLSKARVVADQVVLTRQWVTDCMGGVFVHTASPGARDVTFATQDRITTRQGTYQLFTPSMVTKKLSQYSFTKNSYHFRLTSLTPLNPDNTPDTFESEGLLHFGRDQAREYFKFSDTVLDYMVPLYKTRGCVKCHASETIQKSTIIGGLRISIPFESARERLEKNQILLGGTGLVITLVTMGVLIVLIRFLVLNPLAELEARSRQLTEGDLSSRVTLRTGDELERLGDSFNLMAQSLSRHRDTLEEKVATATRDLAQANQELLKLDKLKSDFLANMSHELRTPLTAVRGSIDYLKRAETDPAHREYLLIIEKNISRLTRLIANLFDYTKLEAGSIDWEFETADICQLTEEVLEIMGPIAEQSRVRLQADCPGALMAVFDLERMEQVLVNLVDNAIRFSPTDAVVTATVRDMASEGEGRVQIRITDQGPGILIDPPDQIFEKFYADSREKAPKGAGMGLTICRAIVTAHGGNIHVSRTRDNLTCFTISLPKDPHAPN